MRGIDKLIMSITPDDRGYPPLLREISDRPSRLYVINPIINWNSAVPVAIAGTREPTSYGVVLTRKIIKALIDEGFKPIVTGGARGIDRIALRVSATYDEDGVEVLPCISLREDIYYSTIEMVSEHLCTGNWRSRMSGWLVERNRIVVGMSYALIIPEARVSNPEWHRYGVACCGTYHAVKKAKEYGQPVFVITPLQDSLKNEDIKEAYRLIVNAGAEPVGDTQELIKELKYAVKR
jgi:predicted Rossmann fold nucleotide-binding protein DprA/Smf involved in DNA uptake